MARILRRGEAEQDLAELWFFIAGESGLERADAFLDQVEEKALRLAGTPYMGRARDDLAPGLRSFPVASFMIFYMPLADGIELVRVLNARRNLGVIFAAEEN